MKIINFNILLSFLAMILSFILMLNYYNNANEITNLLCEFDNITDVEKEKNLIFKQKNTIFELKEEKIKNPCELVAASSYSYIDFYLIGKVSLANIGIVFYSFLFIYFILYKIKKEKSFIFINLALLFLGFLININLYLISILLINALCSLCLYTYIIEFILLVTSFIQAIKLRINLKNFVSCIAKNFKMSLYLFISLFTFSLLISILIENFL